MDPGANAIRPGGGFGALLREWRSARRVSQLSLALDVGISPRHLSCVETGKAQPSREVISRLADALDVPLRDRNALLVAAGYAPIYPETALGTQELAQIRQAIEFIMGQQEPYPAFLYNRHWDVMMENRAAVRLFRFMMGGRECVHRNMLRRIFDPQDLRPAVANWEEVARDLIRHLHSNVAACPSDSTARALLDELLAYPGVPQRWRVREICAPPPSPLMTTLLRSGSDQACLFSTITMFGTPRDVTIDELHIECCFPMDDETSRLCRKLAAVSP